MIFLFQYALLDVNGFWKDLVELMDRVEASGFISAARRAQLLVAFEIGEAIDMLDRAIEAAETRMVW